MSGRTPLKDADGEALVAGAFYWVHPVYCPDMPDDWGQEEQPARFAGYDHRGQAEWNYLNIEDRTPWPVRWIGQRIRMKR